MQVHVPNLEAEYATFLDEGGAALARVAEIDSYILIRRLAGAVG